MPVYRQGVFEVLLSGAAAAGAPVELCGANKVNVVTAATASLSGARSLGIMIDKVSSEDRGLMELNIGYASA